MGKITKEEIISNLKYLGIDDGNFPDYLKEYNPVSFRTSRMQNDKDHKLFQYVPINKIEILFTPKRRNDNIQEKYSEAVPLSKYLDFEDENDEQSATLFNILARLNINEVEKIEEFQNSVKEKEPFLVKFNKDHLWQIYYSSETNTYFMLVCTKEDTFAEFFYLLKKKIEYGAGKFDEVPKIYVPISYVNYSGSFLSNDEITDLENYMWYFTKEWPLIFEVYDPNNKLSFQIIGTTYVYENIKSYYKEKFESKEDVIKFFKLLKALFIMQTEIKNHFSFITQIDENNRLQFSYNDKNIDYDSLHEFIRDEYIYCIDAINEQIKESKKLNNSLSKLRLKTKEKEEEYLSYQNQISTFLDYKKSFFGKVRYFLKGSKVSDKKKKLSPKKEASEEKKESNDNYKNKLEMHTIDTIDTQKDYYTLEDLVVIFSNREKNTRIIDDINNDTKAISSKLDTLTRKTKNAKLYIDEIDNHRKSIFDFWRYANKDDNLALEEGKAEDTSNVVPKKVRKVFNFETDFQEYTEDMDLYQRTTLSKDELDALFVANTDLLDIINNINNKINNEKIEAKLNELKEKFEHDRLIISKETFDIFGNIKNDNTKTQYIGSKSHRENEKDLLKILSINKSIELKEFKEKLKSIKSNLDSANQKIKSKADMYLYKVIAENDNIKENGYEIFDINVENCLKDYNCGDETTLKIIKLNFLNNYPINYYTNSTLFDNTNKTLPLGMDLSTKVIIDMEDFDFKLDNQIDFKTNNYLNKDNGIDYPKVYDIVLLEYNVSLKDADSDTKISKATNTRKKASAPKDEE